MALPLFPLCGDEWYLKHKDDYSQADIDALGIVVVVDQKKLPRIVHGDKAGTLKKLTAGQERAKNSAC